MTNPWPVHTVVFDLDDTLYAERDFALSGFVAAGAWLKATHQQEGFADAAIRIFATGSRGKVFDEALGQLGRTDLLAAVPGLVDAYRRHPPVIRLESEAVEVLDWAKARFRLALISDGYLEVQERKAAALGIRRWIDCLVFSDRWGRDAWKPNERSFREVMTQSPGEPGGYVYVSDNPRKDFIAPRRLGWKTVRFRRAGGEHASYEPTAAESAHCEIASLVSLKTLLMPSNPA